MTTTQTGDITEQKFILKCLTNGIPISRPICNNLPYDFIIEKDNKLLKIQVKTGYQLTDNNVFTFNTQSSSKNYSEVVGHDYVGKIDFFAAYCVYLDVFVFVSIEQAKKSSMNIYYGDSPKKIKIILKVSKLYNSLRESFKFSRI